MTEISLKVVLNTITLTQTRKLYILKILFIAFFGLMLRKDYCSFSFCVIKPEYYDNPTFVLIRVFKANIMCKFDTLVR